MSGKIPSDAFDYYFGLGAGRSYQAVADRCEVSKRAVTKLAARENWQDRLAKRDREVRERSDKRAVETLDSMNARHLKTLQVMQGKALEALKTMPIGSAMEAVRTLEQILKDEIRSGPRRRELIAQILNAAHPRDYLSPSSPTGPRAAGVWSPHTFRRWLS